RPGRVPRNAVAGAARSARLAWQDAARERGERAMISELVMFDLPEGMTRAEVVEGVREGALAWRRNPDVIGRTFLYHRANPRTVALYLWKTRAAAEAAHDAAWRQRVMDRYGSVPTLQYFETPLVVDNALGETIEG